jgi:hypothetical protein
MVSCRLSLKKGVTMKCLICRSKAEYGDLCKECWLGLKCFERNTKFLGRAIAYLKRKGTLLTKHEARRDRKLRKLIAEQQKDAHDRIIRFEHAMEKD